MHTGNIFEQSLGHEAASEISTSDEGPNRVTARRADADFEELESRSGDWAQLGCLRLCTSLAAARAPWTRGTSYPFLRGITSMLLANLVTAITFVVGECHGAKVFNVSHKISQAC